MILTFERPIVYHLAPSITVYDEHNNVVAYIERKAFKAYEEIIGYTNKDKTTIIFTSKAETINDIAGKYSIFTAANEPVGAIQKDLGAQIKTWRSHVLILDREGNQVGEMVEKRFVDVKTNQDQIDTMLHGRSIVTYRGEQVGVMRTPLSKVFAGLIKLKKVFCVEYTDTNTMPKELQLALPGIIGVLPVR